MTDTTPDRAHDDELLSAHLDGELAPHEATRLEARLAAEPALRARLGALRAAAAAIGAGVPAPSPVDRERAVAEAVRAGGRAGGDPLAARVVDIGERRRRRTLVALSAAAVVLVVALAVPLLGNGDDAGDAGEAGTMAAGRGVEADEEAGGTAQMEEAADEAAPSGAGRAPLLGRDLGSLTSPDEVAAAVTAALVAADASGSAEPTFQAGNGEGDGGADATARCEAAARAAVPDAGELVLSGFAVFAGEEAYVLVFATTATPGRQAVVVGADACDVLAGPLGIAP